MGMQMSNIGNNPRSQKKRELSDDSKVTNGVGRAVIKFSSALAVVLFLLLIEWTCITDAELRRVLIIVTGACGLIAVVLLGIQMALEMFKVHATTQQKSKLKSIRDPLIVGLVTVYFTLNAILNIDKLRRDVTAPSAIDVVIVAAFSSIAIIGLVVFVRMIKLRMKE